MLLGQGDDRTHQGKDISLAVPGCEPERLETSQAEAGAESAIHVIAKTLTFYA